MKSWLLKILDTMPFNNWLVDRVRKSLNRDSKFPIRYLIYKGATLFKSLMLSRFYLRNCDRVGKYPRTEKKPYIINNGQINIGDHVNITSRSVQCELVTYPTGKIDIADNVFINFGTTVVANQCVKIGNNVKIGPYCMIHDTDFHVPGEDFTHSEGKAITIEDDVWVNSRVLIMKGSVIGEGSVIAAGSVVSGIIPPNVVAGGVPAKIIKELNGEDSAFPKASYSQAFATTVKQIMAKTLDVNTEAIAPNTSPSNVSGWTSKTHETLIRKLELQFDIDIKPNDKIRMSNFDKICRILEKSYLNSITHEGEYI